MYKLYLIQNIRDVACQNEVCVTITVTINADDPFWTETGYI